jgi:hypothetical protein
MPSVQEVLQASGFTTEQIAAFDAKALSALNGALTTVDSEKKAVAEAATKADELRQQAATLESEAKKRLEKAELVERSNRDFYDGQIMPALTGWTDERNRIENERIKAVAEAQFYKTQAEAAKDKGFIAAEAPAFTFTPPAPAASGQPPRDPQSGQYVAGAPGAIPGSPTLMDNVRGALSDTTWTLSRYQQLYNQPFPNDPMVDAQEANSLKLGYRDHIARKYKFAEREQQIQQEAQKRHDDEVRAEASKEWELKLKAEQEKAKTDLEKARQDWAERAGNNPDVRTATTSRMSEVARAAKEGQRPDPLKQTLRERHETTRKQINERIAQEAVA